MRDAVLAAVRERIPDAVAEDLPAGGVAVVVLAADNVASLTEQAVCTRE